MTKTKTKAQGGLTLKHKIGYALGDAGGCMTFLIMGKFFANYCTDVLKIEEGLVSLLLLVWNIWDFINDPLMGALMDKSFAKNKTPVASSVPGCFEAHPLSACSSLCCSPCPPSLTVLQT